LWNSCIKKRLISQGLDPNTHNLIISSHEQASIKVACKISQTHQQQQPIPILFTLTNSQLSDASMEMKTPFVTILNNSSSSSSINPSGIDQLTNHEKNCFWGATREPSEAQRLEGQRPLRQEDQQENKEENSYQIGEGKGNDQIMDTSFDSFNFDLGLVESTHMSGLMHYDLSPMAGLAWN
jgi:myb proto-oncogene protein